MSHQSSTQTLTRKVAVFGVIFVGVGVLLHFTIPWFDFGQLLAFAGGILGDYPRVGLLLGGFVVLMFIATWVDDLFS